MELPEVVCVLEDDDEEEEDEESKEEDETSLFRFCPFELDPGPGSSSSFFDLVFVLEHPSWDFLFFDPLFFFF